jgi:N-acetylglucosaminyl-diphospho-decaprenol L-rhamnosyltransferase
VVSGSKRTLSVVIVTFNAERYIQRCLDSVLAFAPRSACQSVWVVDNSSSDDTVGIVKAGYPAISLIERGTNDGFAVANNEALRTIESDFVLVLNPDTELREGVLDGLLEHFGDPSIGIAGCRLVRSDGTFDHASKRSLPTAQGAARYFASKLGLPVSSQYTAPDIAEHGQGIVEAINGAFMLIRGSALAEVGLLDERYWMYAEDLDWCRRFADAGWRIYYDGSQTVLHLKGAAAGTFRPIRLNWHFHHSMAQYYSKFEAGRSRPQDGAAYSAIYGKFALSVIWSGVRRSLDRITVALERRTR